MVKLYDIDHQGNEKVLHILKPPSLMPLTALGQRSEDTAWFYSTITDCDVYTVTSDELEQRMESESALAAFLLRQQAREMNELLVRLSALAKTTPAASWRMYCASWRSAMPANITTVGGGSAFRSATSCSPT